MKQFKPSDFPGPTPEVRGPPRSTGILANASIFDTSQLLCRRCPRRTYAFFREIFCLCLPALRHAVALAPDCVARGSVVTECRRRPEEYPAISPFRQAHGNRVDARSVTGLSRRRIARSIFRPVRHALKYRLDSLRPAESGGERP